MARKSEQLQIRVTPREKAAIKRLARQAGQDLSSYVLARSLPEQRARFSELLRAIRSSRDQRFALAELNDLLSGLASRELADTVRDADLRGMSSFVQNYVAAMVEYAATLKGVEVPNWVHEVEPLDEPWFATRLRCVRLHLLRSSPVAFKRRNIFVDSSIGSRV